MLLKVKIIKVILAIIVFLFSWGILSGHEAFSSKNGAGTGGDNGYVDVYQIIEYFGLYYEFDEWAGILTLKKGPQVITIQMGEKGFYYRGKSYSISLPSYIMDGKIYISGEVVDFIVRRIVRRRIKWKIENNNFVVMGRETKGRGIESRKMGPEPRAIKRRIDVIILDPGHGGKDPGGIGYNGIKEKDIVLDVAKLLQKELKRTLNKKIIMTRKDDTFVSLEERSKIANSNNNRGNSIFVSIHANVALESGSNGFESYYLSLHPFGENARDVAELENAVISYEEKPYADYLKEVLNRVVDVEYRKESMRLADYINTGITESVNQVMPNRGVKGAFFYVLKESKMVAVLIEIGFITNKREAELLQNKDYQSRLAKGLATGIINFIDEFEKTNGFTEGY